ncbi:hypothetical protein V6N12_025479 [Hibiscus sabdariffa]|uniref:DUF4283 domain-containing protein n=1 Tax=Hibiscus sabdariffa TaxID=183260 RepID=A0ABR2CIK8_9ROSI
MDGRFPHQGFQRKSIVGKVVKKEVFKRNVCWPTVYNGSFKDTISFKDTLLGKERSSSTPCEPPVRDLTSIGNVKKTNDELVMVEEHPSLLASDVDNNNSKFISIPCSKMELRNFCLVSNIKSMYNLEVVHEALASDGFQAIVCPWSGLLVVIYFPCFEDRARCWAIRNDLLKLWFNDLELLEGVVSVEHEVDRIFIDDDSPSDKVGVEFGGTLDFGIDVNTPVNAFTAFEGFPLLNVEIVSVEGFNPDSTIAPLGHVNQNFLNQMSDGPALHDVPILSVGSSVAGVSFGPSIDSG